jgi:peptidyl-prolyl cis-trans isomerase D
MGIIGSIRKHSWIAVALVGIAILAFIAGDKVFDIFKKDNRDQVGKVAGVTMNWARFNERVTEMEDNYKMQQQTTQVPAEMEMQIRDQVWQQFVDETLMEEQTSKLGLQVTTAEVNDMYTGTFIHPYIRQSFTDPKTGQFDIRQVNYWIENFDQLDTMRRMQWVELEKYVKRDREQQKYSTLIEAGFYMPTAIAKQVAEYGNNSANVRVVALPFQSVSDDEITLSEADYTNYYNTHKADFRVRDEFRDIDFITFPVVPTPQDLTDIQEQVQKVWDEFQTTPDDEMAFFVNAESDRPYDSSYVRATTFKAPFDEQIAAANAGTYIAPAMVDGEWMMAKVMGTAVRPDSLRASVVYILNQNAGGGITRSNDQAKSLADSVLAMLKTNKMSFEQAVEQYSDDPQKDETKGDMNWQLDGGYGFLNEDIINTPVGGCFIYEHPQGVGYFIVKVTDKTPAAKKYRVALVTREIVPSNATDKAAHEAARKFAGQNRTAAEFTAAAQQQNLQVRNARVMLMSSNIAGINNARSIVQWVFNDDTKIGDVADQVYSCDGMYVVVSLKDIYKKGYATLEQVHPMLEQPVRIEKKGELLMARAEEAVKAAKDITSIAVKLNVAIDTIDSVAFTDYYFGRYGMEPKVQSAIAAAQNGLVGPIKGASGVYLVQVDSKAPRTVSEEAVKARMMQAYRNKSRMVSQTLRDGATINDNRNKFF